MSKLSKRDKQGGCGKRPFAGMSKMRPNAAGLDSAAALKKVPGRKTDVLDSQWIQTLHSYGLLNASFRPEGEIERTFSSVPGISASLTQTIVA